MKHTSTFVCQQCGAQSPSFLGKCPNCGEWNSMVEQSTSPNLTNRSNKTNPSKPVKLSEIPLTSTNRVSTGIEELDMVLGGGVVPGMAILLSGEPGIGKSTILLEIANKISVKSDAHQSVGSVLYIAGEESASQIKIRADRLKIKAENLTILETTDVDSVINFVETHDRASLCLLIIDSIQTMVTSDLTGTAGSVGQVRECAARIINTIKPLNIPTFIVGHVTKDGTIAGPKVLEHAVDTILTIEGEKYGQMRLIRTTKNRFGPTDEVGVFEMTDSGLKTLNLSNLPAEALAKEGSCYTITMEGTRPMLVEIQALVTSTPIPNPRRVASGVNYNRLQTIVAILQKRLNIPLYKEDVYVSASGGLKIEEPAIDLAIALAIISSYKNKPLPAKSLAIGELDLLGNVRPVNNNARRLKEAKRLGFKPLSSLHIL